MKLIINKFPPINQKSVIDLSKKMMIFVGENNSGKTYISKLIWAIFNIDGVILYRDNIEIFNKGGQVLEVDLLDVKDKIEDLYNKHLNEFLDKIFGDKEFDIRVVFEKEDFKKSYINVIHYDIFDKNIITKDINSTILRYEIKQIETNSNKNIDRSDLKDINKNAYYYIIKALLNQNTVYLPENRIIMPKIYNYLPEYQRQKTKRTNNFNIISHPKEDDLTDFELPFESDITEEILFEKILLETEKEKNNEYLSKLEEILGGEIKKVKRDGIGFPYFTYYKNNIEILLERSSSMVNQLTLLYLFFKYWYEKENFLIIDEPELGLHLQKQIELMEFLMDFASKNKLLMTTHSHIMAKTIINYIELLDLKNKNRDKYQKILKEFDLKDIDLKSEDIGIYYFNGNAVIPYKEDDRSNIHFRTFSEVEKKLKDIYWIIDDYKENDEVSIDEVEFGEIDLDDISGLMVELPKTQEEFNKRF